MVDRISTSFFQTLFGVSSSKVGLILTTTTQINPFWNTMGKIALILGVLASMIAIYNGLKVAFSGIKQKLSSMKSLSKSISSTITEVRARWKAETPKFFASFGRFLIIVAIATGGTILSDKMISLNYNDMFREIVSYVFFASLFGALVCKLSVKNTDELYKILKDKLKNQL